MYFPTAVCAEADSCSTKGVWRFAGSRLLRDPRGAHRRIGTVWRRQVIHHECCACLGSVLSVYAAWHASAPGADTQPIAGVLCWKLPWIVHHYKRINPQSKAVSANVTASRLIEGPSTVQRLWQTYQVSANVTASRLKERPSTVHRFWQTIKYEAVAVCKLVCFKFREGWHGEQIKPNNYCSRVFSLVFYSRFSCQGKSIEALVGSMVYMFYWEASQNSKTIFSDVRRALWLVCFEFVSI